MRHLSRPIQNRKWWFRKPCITEIIAGTKGQLNSECIYEVIVSPKMPTKNFLDFCPKRVGQKSGKFLVMTVKFRMNL